ncbi:hypothetical protein D9C73_027113 [Collichthys lucidus]|uniref:Uncharacterized protein n=1 Tax=Collichthys lucidus TaxID=240159 RepID=A0A4U5VXQ2_COLLU|nr:hypothetical protein D9C73_027113 [Collichthys lucidus]
MELSNFYDSSSSSLPLPPFFPDLFHPDPKSLPKIQRIQLPSCRHRPFRRVTFSVVSQPQDPHQQGSLQSCYDSGLDESETPSSKSSSGPRLGALPLPEDSYERTTPDGSVGEAEHMENGRGKH